MYYRENDYINEKDWHAAMEKANKCVSEVEKLDVEKGTKAWLYLQEAKRTREWVRNCLTRRKYADEMFDIIAKHLKLDLTK